MAIAQTSFNITDGNLGRTPLPADAISGLVIYNDNIGDLASPVTSDNNIFPIYSLSEAEDLEIDGTGNFADSHYIISEYFRQGGGKLWLGIFPVPASYDFTEIDTMHSESNGEIRQYGVYIDKAYDNTDVATLNSVLEEYWSLKKPTIAIFGADYSTIDLSTINDVRTGSPRVSVVLGQDTENYPATLSKSMPNIGAVLGALSASNVATNILYVNEFNYTDGTQMVTPGFYVDDGTGTPTMKPITHKDFNDTFLDNLDSKGYVFWRYLANVSGTYLNNAHNSGEITSDFAYIHNNRVMGKAIRKIDSRVSKLLGSPIQVSNGKIRTSSLVGFNSALNVALNSMVENDEISGFDFFIDPSQDIASTNELKIQVSIVPVFTSDKISMEIGYTV